MIAHLLPNATKGLGVLVIAGYMAETGGQPIEHRLVNPHARCLQRLPGSLAEGVVVFGSATDPDHRYVEFTVSLQRIKGREETPPGQVAGDTEQDQSVGVNRVGSFSIHRPEPNLSTVIHEGHPFADDAASRDPVRQFRGRLSAPVTIITSGDDADRAGLTVSSLIVVEGQPGRIEAVVGPTTDLWDTAESTGRFVVHVCGSQHRTMAEVFARLRPSPGGVFAGLDVSSSDWGPVLSVITDRAFCTVESRREVGYTGLVTARIDRIEVGDLTDPLIYFRGAYHGLQ